MGFVSDLFQSSVLFCPHSEMENYKLSCHLVCFVLFRFLDVKTDRTSCVKRNELNKILISKQREHAWATRSTQGDGGTSSGFFISKEGMLKGMGSKEHANSAPSKEASEPHLSSCLFSFNKQQLHF